MLVKVPTTTKLIREEYLLECLQDIFCIRLEVSMIPILYFNKRNRTNWFNEWYGMIKQKKRIKTFTACNLSIGIRIWSIRTALQPWREKTWSKNFSHHSCYRRWGRFRRWERLPGSRPSCWRCCWTSWWWSRGFRLRMNVPALPTWTDERWTSGPRSTAALVSASVSSLASPSALPSWPIPDFGVTSPRRIGRVRHDLMNLKHKSYSLKSEQKVKKSICR